MPAYSEHAIFTYLYIYIAHIYHIYAYLLGTALPISEDCGHWTN